MKKKKETQDLIDESQERKEKKDSLNTEIRETFSKRMSELLEQYGIIKDRTITNFNKEIADKIHTTDKMVSNYILGKAPCSPAALIAIANYFSNRTDKNGNINIISVDYLLGRTDHTSCGNEEIYRATGLSDKAVDHLRVINQDDELVKNNNLDSLFNEHAILKTAILPVVNFILSSSKLSDLCHAFSNYAQTDSYQKLAYKTDNGFSDVTGSLYMSARNGVMAEINNDSSFLKAINKNILDGLLTDLVYEYKESQKLDKEFPEIFELGEKYGMTYDETLALIMELSKETVKKTVKEMKRKQKK